MKALLVDAAGTLLHPREPVARTYARFASARGVPADEALVGSRFREALARRDPGLRFAGDGRPFWREVVRRCVGSGDPEIFEDLYGWFARPEAWEVAEGAADAFSAIRSAGKRVALVSNWDTRLRPLLEALGLAPQFDAVIVPGEVGLEKPDPAIFALACARLGVRPAEAVHLGNDPAEDVAGARAAGCAAWLWGTDVRSFEEVRVRLA